MRIALRLLIAVLACALVYLHWFLPAQVERGINVKLALDLPTVSEEAQQLHDTLFIADLHADSLLWKRDLSRASDVGHVDLPRLRQGNVTLQVFSATTKSPKNQNYTRNDADSDRITLLAVASFWPPRTWNSLYERAAYQLEKLHELAATDALTLITDQASFRDLLRRREAGEQTVGGLYLIEGAHPLEGDLDKLDRLYDRGLRIVGLTHFFDNETGGSLHGISGEGLTEFGRAVVRRANELDMIIDIAHASPAMAREVLELSTQPVILSHGGVKSACDTARNFDDELMRELARRGGLLGVGYWRGAVCDPTPAGVVRSIRHAIDLMGIEHVALGSDYDGAVAVSFDTSQLAVVTEAMLRAGFSEREIRLVMGDNVRRFLLENLPE